MTADRDDGAMPDSAGVAEESAGFHAGRVFALSDGVFAIAATLLALDLRIPDGLDAAGLAAALGELYPALDGYLISYLVIGLLWMGHHATFYRFRRITGSVVALNIVLLGLVAVLPFPSALLARYSEYPVAVVLYAADVGAVSLLQVAILALGWRNRDICAAPALSVFLPASCTTAVFAISIPIALVSPVAAMYSWLLLVPLHIAVNWILKRPPRPPR